MTRAATVRRSDLDRVLAALKAAGESIAGAEVQPGGAVRILTGAPVAVTDSVPVAPLDAWREKRQRGASAA